MAIVLEPHVPDAPIFTPDDAEWDWATAKAFVLNADSQYHMVVAYYLKTFAVAEPFVVSMHRQVRLPVLFARTPKYGRGPRSREISTQGRR